MQRIELEFNVFSLRAFPPQHLPFVFDTHGMVPTETRKIHVEYELSRTNHLFSLRYSYEEDEKRFHTHFSVTIPHENLCAIGDGSVYLPVSGEDQRKFTQWVTRCKEFGKQTFYC